MASPLEDGRRREHHHHNSGPATADRERITAAAPNGRRPSVGASSACIMEKVTARWAPNDVKDSGKTNCENGKGDLGLIMANYSASFEELSLVGLQPTSTTTGTTTSGGAQIERQRPAHNNDSVISMEAIRASTSASSSTSSDGAHASTDLAGRVSGATTMTAAPMSRNHSEPATTRSVSGGANAQTSQPHPANNSGDGNGSSGNNNNGNNNNGLWMMSMAAQTSQEVRQRVSMASDQLGLSLRQLYASATTSMSGGALDVPPPYQNIPGVVPYYRGRSSGPPPSYDDVINPYAAPPTYQSLFGQMREAGKNSRGLIDLLKRLVILGTIGCSLLLAFVILVPFSMIVVGAVYLNDCRVENIPAFLLVGGLVWASKNIIHCCAQCRDDAPASGSAGAADNNSHLDEDLPDYGYYEQQQQLGHQSDHSQLTGQTNELSLGADIVDRSSMSPRAGATFDLPPDNQMQTERPFRRQTNRGRRATKSSICESLLNCILFGWFVAGCVIVFRNHNPDFEDPNSPKFCNRIVYMYTFWLITSGLVVFSLFVSCICCLMISSAIATRQDDDLG